MASKLSSLDILVDKVMKEHRDSFPVRHETMSIATGAEYADDFIKQAKKTLFQRRRKNKMAAASE